MPSSRREVRCNREQGRAREAGLPGAAGAGSGTTGGAARLEAARGAGDQDHRRARAGRWRLEGGGRSQSAGGGWWRRQVRVDAAGAGRWREAGGCGGHRQSTRSRAAEAWRGAAGAATAVAEEGAGPAGAPEQGGADCKQRQAVAAPSSQVEALGAGRRREAAAGTGVRRPVG
jgi:hypothetical protein